MAGQVLRGLPCLVRRFWRLDMLTAQVVLRIIAALLECQVQVLEKATPEQVQGFIDRHEERLARFEAILKKVMPGD